MILSNLEIVGFKSFPKRVKLEFGPGITGIVGPNGCGKSNLVDAIRWVMGEQKGSVLRSDKMEQVIFAGTVDRKPLGMAEVSLTVDNNNGILPPEYTTITVTRRLYRDRESDYLINNQKRRLKDIVDMFLDTGLGADSYSIIEPELIQRILSEDPEERRILFEEAVGIAKYKIRVKTAHKRLEEVNGNLERLTDILSEVEKNVRNLKKQYNQAKVYETLRSRQNEIEVLILALERAELWDELIKASKTCDNWRKQLKEKEAVKIATEGELRRIIESLNATEAQIKENRSTYERIQTELMDAQNHLLLLEEKERNAVLEKERSEENWERDRQRCVYFEERIAGQQAMCDKLNSELSGLQVETTAIRERFISAEKNAKSAQVLVEEAGKRISVRKNEASLMEKEISQSKYKIASFAERMKNLDEEDCRLSAEISELAEIKRQAERDKLGAEKSWLSAQEKLNVNETALTETRNNIEHIEREKARLQIKVERLKSEAQYLHSLLASGGGLPAGTAKLLEIKPSGLIDTLGNIIGIKPEYATAIESALSENAYLLLSETEEEAFSIVKLLQQNPLGRATIVSLNHRFGKVKSPTPLLPGVIAIACDLVECESRYRQLVEFLLSDTLVVEKWEDALSILQSGAWEGNLVTLNGETLSPIALSAGKSKDSYPAVGRRQLVDKIEGEIVEIQDKIRLMEEDLANLLQTRTELEKGADLLTGERDNYRNGFNQALAVLATFEGRSSALLNRQETIAKEVKELKTDESLTKKSLAEVELKMRELTSEIACLEKDLAEKQLKSNNYNKDWEKQRDLSHQAELKLASRQGEFERVKAELNLAQARHNELAEEMARLRASIIKSEEMLVAGKSEKSAIQNAISLKKQSLEEWKAKLDKIEGDYRSGKDKRSEIEQILRDIFSEIDKVKTEVSAYEVIIAGLKSKISAKEDASMARFGVDLSALEIPEDCDKINLEKEVEKLKRKISAIGPVNLLALEEYGKEKERFDFLQGEHKDIVQSKDELLETITKTNTEARARFRRVFAEVQQHFRLLFSDLFDGGEGELSLSEGDPLEAKIELRTNPAGKKLLSLEQLSGGEKTLTALALLFALYQVKPGPFCILDEVDAPLDDANVDRFLKLLHRFSPNTQFILITHNKITMEACDCLYGVTMEEEGISKIASLRLENISK